MKDKSRRKKVFISYAREDQAQAEKIYQYLSDASFEPWMDVHDIVSGDDWLKSITRAITQTDYFLAILSHHSVDKPGVLQEELDIALEICRKIPDPEIFLIPVRLEECRMPEKISRFQWVNLFAEDGWVRLLRALHQERQKTRKWVWWGLVPLTTLLLVAGFMAVWAASQPIKIDPALYGNACKASEAPLQVGLASLKSCPLEDRDVLDSMWAAESVQITPLDQSIASSQQARSISGYDLIVWGSCSEQTTLQFELVSSRKPDDVYEPSSVQVTGTLTEVGNVGKALISYQRGEYAEAARQFEATDLAVVTPELSVLRSNSLMFSARYEDAISVLQETVLKQTPESGAVYNNLGVAQYNSELLQGKSGFIYKGLSEFDQAIQYASAQKDTDTLLLAYANKGTLLRRAGSWEDAESACRAALQVSAQSSIANLCLAHYKLVRSTDPSAQISLMEIQNDLNNAERYGPPPAKFHYVQASLYQRQHQDQEALAGYERFLAVMQDRACLELDWNFLRDTARSITSLKH